jgi:hypothetical protein
MKWIFIILILLFAGWKAAVFLMNRNGAGDDLSATDSLPAQQFLFDSSKKDRVKKGFGKLDMMTKNQLPLLTGNIDTKGVEPQQIAGYAKTLIGVPYLYGSADPAKGFDCSGFITYVFNHFNIVVPRSSIDFTNVGTEVSAAASKPGDLILFTGTDSLEKFVGHMGIVISNTDSLNFIHSTSGKIYGVTITPLNNYYKKRYVKIVRVFPQHN